MKQEPIFVRLVVAADQLGVPHAWLRDQAIAKRIPFLNVNRSIFCKVSDVELVLRNQADVTDFLYDEKS